MKLPFSLPRRIFFRQLLGFGWVTIVWLAVGATAWANVPGGGTTGANVTLVDNGNGTVTIGNGIVSFVCTKSSAVIGQINYTHNNGSGNTTDQVLAGGKDGGMLYWEFGGFGTGAFNYSVVANPANNSGNYAEIDMVSNWSGNTATPAGDAEVHFSMLRGSPGFYVTLTLSHRNTYPAVGLGEVRTNIYTAPYFNWMSVDSTRDQQYNNGGTAVAVLGAPQECTLWTTGFAQGLYEDKYKYSALFGTERVWGWSSVSNTTAGFTGKNIGIWNVLASAEFYNGGPLKPELMDAPMVNMFNGGHYQMGSDSSWANNEAWTKVYGPYFVYFNNLSNSITDPVQVSRALYADALAQGVAEQTAWPYAWFNNANYAPAANRGTVTGRIVINDVDNPNASAAGLWVGVSQTPSTTDNVYDFQQWMKPYQFWVQSDAGGNFTIPNVIAGSNYTLFAFGPGAAGTFQSQSLTASPAVLLDIPASPFSVTVTGGGTTNLGDVTWTPARVGPTVFEIGYPDRTARKFRHGDDWWKGDVGPSPTSPSPIWTKFLEYPLDFPSEPNYVVGQSRWSTDWNFIQPVVTDSQGNYNGSTSTITFNLAQTPAVGAQASFYIGLASDYAGPLIVKVNGNNLSVPTTGYFPFYGDSDTSVRENTNAAFSDSRLNFAGSLLHQGANNITINMRKGGYFANHAMYDYLRLELTSYVPPAPSGLTAYAGNNQMLLSWPVTPGATSYNILRSTISGSGYATLATHVPGPVCGSGPGNATYVDATAVNGTTYYYEVQSVNPVGTSGNSAESDGTAPSVGAATAAPVAPTGLAATAGNASVALTWAAVNGANYYTVYRSTKVNEIGTVAYGIVLSNTVTGPSYTDTSPTNGSTYNYWVTASNSAGDSGNSTTASATPVPNAPASAPGSVALSTSPGQTKFSWAAVPGAVGYIVQRATSPGGPFTFVMSVTETSYTNTGLGNNTAYYYTVTAVNAGGTSASSSTVNITTPPAPPASLAAIPGNMVVVLSWPAVTSATSYNILRGTATGGPYSTVATGITTLNYTDTGRTNGTTYYYVVTATDASGTSVNSSETGATPNTSIAGLLWSGLASTAWDITTANWVDNGGTALYTDGSFVTVNDGAANTTLVISGTISPGSVLFNNSATAYTVSGAGRLAGQMALTKSGTGTLTLSPTLISVANCTTTANSTIITVASSANLSAGMLVTVNTTGVNGLPDGATIASITDDTHIVLSQNVTRANTNATLNFSWANTFSGGTILNGGTMALGSVNANDAGLGPGPITFNGGTLSLYNWNGNNLPGSGTLPNDLVVSGTGTILAMQRGTIASSVTGIGTLALNIPYVRTDLTGNWAAFNGQLNVVTASSGTSDLRLNKTTGLPSGAINLGAKTQAYFTGTVAAGGTSISLGEVSGVSGTSLKGGATANAILTWVVGGRNTNATFAGNITEQAATDITAINKIGTGTWILDGTNTYAGKTTVSAGTLLLSGAIGNTSSVEVLTGATLTLSGGNLTAPSTQVDSGGTLDGSGTINGALINNGLVTAASGQALVFNGLVTNNGVMIFTGGSTLSNNSTFTNYGTLDMMTSGLALPTNFTNHGVVLDSSAVKVSSIAVVGGVVQIKIQSYAGHNYQLQWSASLNPLSWQNLGSTQTGSGSVLTFTDASAISAGIGFYRVIVSP